MSPDRRGRVRRAAAVAARLAIVAAAALFLGRGVGWAEVGKTLRGAKPALLVGVVALNGAMMAVKAARLRLLLGGRPSFGACFLAKLTTSAINNVTPLRGGDLARVWMLERHAGITKSGAAVVAVTETLLELGALSALAVAAVLAAPGQDWAAGVAPMLLAGAALVLLLLGRAGRRRPDLSPPARARGLGARLRALRARIEPGVVALGQPRTAGVALALSFAAWCVEVAMVMLCARALHLPVGVPLAVLVLLGINVALVLPSLPAGAGAFEAAATLVLTLSGIGKDPAVAFAILYHVVQVVPVTVAGALVVSRVGVTLSGLAPRRLDGAR